MADREKDIRLFQRAARQRLDTARFLLEHGFTLDSIYLAGYAVECALKALILRRTPRGQHAGMLEMVTQGSKGHDFDYLKGLLKERLARSAAKDREVFGKLTETFKIVATWSTDLRYQVGHVEPDEASDFLEAAQEIQKWCTGD